MREIVFYSAYSCIRETQPAMYFERLAISRTENIMNHMLESAAFAGLLINSIQRINIDSRYLFLVSHCSCLFAKYLLSAQR